ncbi:MAG: polyprenyl synthetase family protein [Acetatifactor sp.]|nr:polyprenyl synthetase family protein [Acetatifactor sp.]
MAELKTEDFISMLESKTKEIEQIVMKYLPEERGYQKTVLEAMNYSVNAGGKRLRPMLISECFKMFGGEGAEVEPFIAAIEMIHTYSLVHDDLPAMDNDEYRRGRKTTWSVYGDALGILAGDGLLNYAFETVLQSMDEYSGHPEVVLRMVKALGVLAKKAGVYGMIGGQTADIEAEGQKESVTIEQLMFIHQHKTAALIEAAMMIGAILAGADEDAVSLIEKCAYNIGIAFQIQDDILDVIGDSTELGKPIGSDAENEKQTYVTIMGMEKSKEDVKRMTEEALGILRTLSGEHVFLEQLILSLVHRRK